MITSNSIEQHPQPGSRLLRFRGDSQHFTLKPPPGAAGTAYIRTNIGRAEITRDEIIRSVQENLPPLGRDWFDIPMSKRNGDEFEITLPLCEVGHFEAKCYFLPTTRPDPLWPMGANTIFNVKPADCCCANIIYNAFVRQFGPNKCFRKTAETNALATCLQQLDERGYTAIPPSGTFRDLIAELDFIMNQLGCRVIQLLPIHPTPTTYARMGRFGSPYAALSFTGIDPALAQFDPHATPLEQFTELVDAIHQRYGKLIIDIAINHTGWAAGIHETHPRWLARESDGRIKVPGAWGVRWEDLTKLDYQHKDLWQYMANVFLTWCRRGVDGFRCDAGYMIPVAAWKYMVARVRREYPDTVFFLEGLGGKTSVTRDILNQAGFDWAYSELFQNYDRQEIESYLPGALDITQGDGILVHFAETHDNLRLAQKSKTFARLRTDLCALFSPNGAFGFANGVEWFASEKIVVHESPSLNWGAQENQVASIARLGCLLRNHPAFHDQTELKLVQTGLGNHIALLRHHGPTNKKLLVVANLDDEQGTLATWQSDIFETDDHPPIDLLTGTPVALNTSQGIPGCQLQPGQVVCLSPGAEDTRWLAVENEVFNKPVARIVHQNLRAKAMEIYLAETHQDDLSAFDPDSAACRLAADPEAFCRELNPETAESRVIRWQWPQDVRRTVMVPPDHFLLVTSAAPFRARLMDHYHTQAQETGLPATDNRWFALFSFRADTDHLTRTLHMTVYETGRPRHSVSPLLFLAPPERLRVQRTYYRSELVRFSRTLLHTNGCGAMLRAPIWWGQLQSRYDALLAANLNPDYPEDRWILFSRCRAWIVFQDYSQEIGNDCLSSFHTDDHGRGVWRFHVPTGQGEHVRLSIQAEMVPAENTSALSFYRHPSAHRDGRLTDAQPVKLILRPDVEHRNFHHSTKAYQGPETQWPRAVTPRPNGFAFAPDPDNPLTMTISSGAYVHEPEWLYMVSRPNEAERGFDPESDLFSPGYFLSELLGDAAVVLTARVVPPGTVAGPDSATPALLHDDGVHAAVAPATPASVLSAALSAYTVVRGEFKTVIAGFPWFLDWGRDALIFARGLVAAGQLSDAKAVIYQFGQFEENGTLPNMIQGANAANRDTSDAPLWFIAAVADLVAAENVPTFLDSSCGNRRVRDIIYAIAYGYISGTSNGIRMDPDSALVYSPAHFTWMDTDHPAGTPRAGYPIEIQALWYHALDFLSRIEDNDDNRWSALAQQVQGSIQRFFFRPNDGFFSDCLHGEPGTPAAAAEPDEALRPNQLLAITLGAITENKICRQILRACEMLLVPGGIRSLADRPVQRPLPIVHEGRALNDPLNPYQGHYAGDEDTRRKPAYHNGTAWTWLFPSYPEAWAMTYGTGAARTARAWLGSTTPLIASGCLGHVPEILDGDAPHMARGCDAQAWGASEWLRVWIKLDTEPGPY